MAFVFYAAVLERAGAGFSVFFPDLPGCVSAGREESEAYLNAEEALAAHIELTMRHGETLPPPSPLSRIKTDPEIDEAGRFLVRAETPGKAIRLNITLDEGLVASIDRVAENRSGFLADAARAALAARREAAGGGDR